MADGNIFISYRRGVDSNAAGRLYDRLERQFDRARLFFDIDSIPLGVDFAEHIDGEVAKCDVQLVVIGPGWLDEVERLHDPDDFVRIEIEAALTRPEIPVIPVLLEGAEMPQRDTLPDSLHPLVRRNAVVLNHAQFAHIVDGRLTAALKATVGDAIASTEPAEATGPFRRIKKPWTLPGAGSLALLTDLRSENPRAESANAAEPVEKPHQMSAVTRLDSGRERLEPASDDYSEPDNDARDPATVPSSDVRHGVASSGKLRKALVIIGLAAVLLGFAYAILLPTLAPKRGFSKIGDGSCTNNLQAFDYYRTSQGQTLEACLQLCRNSEKCTGVTSFQTGRQNCYMHTVKISNVQRLTAENRAVCYAKR